MTRSLADDVASAANTHVTAAPPATSANGVVAKNVTTQPHVDHTTDRVTHFSRVDFKNNAALRAQVQALAGSLGATYRYVNMNIDTPNMLLYDITALPTTIVEVNGVEAVRVHGGDFEKISRALYRAIKS